jgi:pimeloyl-ACP methyl ester carboxylesterase
MPRPWPKNFDVNGKKRKNSDTRHAVSMRVIPKGNSGRPSSHEPGGRFCLEAEMLRVRAFHDQDVITDVPPIFILHGMFGAGDNWQTIARDLSQERQVFTVDMPGHGDSVRELGGGDPRPFRYPAQARLVAATVRECTGSRPVILIGHSMGGKAAMTLALEWPDLVASLIVVDTAPRSYVGSGFNQEVIELLSNLDPARFTSRLDFDAAMKPWIADPVMRAFMMKSLVPDENGGWRWRFAADAILAGATDIADWPAPLSGARYEGPTLFIKGELSPYIEAERDLPAIQSLFPGARLAIVGRARHWVHFDNRAEFVAQLKAFLS